MSDMFEAVINGMIINKEYFGIIIFTGLVDRGDTVIY